MLIYPDNNILIRLEKGEIGLVDIQKIIRTANLAFAFSTAHMYEANTMDAYENFTKEQLLTTRFKLIDDLAKGLYLRINDRKSVEMENRSASDAFNSIELLSV